MNNLHRELAPISDAAWAQIEEVTTSYGIAASAEAKRALRAELLISCRHSPPACQDQGVWVGF